MSTEFRSSILGLAIAIIIGSCFWILQGHRETKRNQSLKSNSDLKRVGDLYHTATQVLAPHFDQRRIISFSIGAILGVLVAFSEPVANWDYGLRALVTLLFSFLGFRFPAIQDETTQKKRQADLENDFPGILDILIVMLDAGATFDEALNRLLDDRYLHGRQIKRELSRLANELRLTPNRQEAFQKFSFSTQSQNLRLFGSVLIQSEIYGTPISKGLRGLALEMRQRQFDAIESKSGALGPKLAIPMTLFFLPLIFIIVLAPTLIRAFKLS